MSVRRSLLLFALAAVLASPAVAQTRGWLRYSDGNAVSGELVEPGLFRSDRFGEVHFLPAEARFEAWKPPAQDDYAPPLPLVAAGPSPSWAPTVWSVRLSGYWEEEDGSTTSDAAIDFEATWRRSAGELDLAINTDFKVVDGDVDNNEQAARGRWFHDLSPSWFAVGLAKARRSHMTIDPMPTVDTLLQGSLGLGARKDWSLRSRSRVALGHDWITVDFLKYDLRFRTHATSFFLENTLRLSPRVRFNNTLYGYLWKDGSWGTDSDAEALYAINAMLSVGLRHEYRHNTVDLDLGSYQKLSLTTRLSF